MQPFFFFYLFLPFFITHFYYPRHISCSSSLIPLHFHLFFWISLCFKPVFFLTHLIRPACSFGSYAVLFLFVFFLSSFRPLWHFLVSLPVIPCHLLNDWLFCLLAVIPLLLHLHNMKGWCVLWRWCFLCGYKTVSCWFCVARRQWQLWFSFLTLAALQRLLVEETAVSVKCSGADVWVQDAAISAAAWNVSFS